MSQTTEELNVGRVKVGDVKEVARQEFLELLDKFEGTKSLVWDKELTSPMDLIAGFGVIKEHNVS